ncbi:MAG TPA: hypothetical protein PK878_00370 [bacterium]|nr:hypothetical protein [bacterium]
MYVGTDTCRFAALLRELPAHWERINTGEQVNRVVRGQEDAFINVDEIIDRRGFDPYWLTTDLAERNPYTSHFIYHACARLVFEAALRECRDNLLVFVEDWYLGFSFWRRASQVDRTATYVSAHALRDRLPGWAALGLHRMDQWLMGGRGRIRFLLDHARQRRVIRRLRREAGPSQAARPDRLDTLFVLWTDENTFPADRHLDTDLFFGPLPARFRNRGDRMGYLAKPMTWVRSYEGIARNVMAAKDWVLLPEECVSLAEAAVIALRTWFHRYRLRGRFVLEGVDLTEYVREEIHIDRMKTRQCRALIYTAVGRYLRRMNQCPARVIYPMECQPWEKALRYGFYVNCSDTKFIGHQHSTIPECWYGLFPSRHDVQNRVIPQRIVTCGPVWKAILEKHGVPARSLRTGPAFRFPHLHGKPAREGKLPRPATVLLALSIGFHDSLECVLKTIAAFRSETSLRVWIKFHPRMSGSPEQCVETAVKALCLGALPDHIQITREPVTDLLPRAGVLLYSGTTVGLEALALSVPVILVQSDLWFDMDILFFAPGSQARARTPEALRASVQRALRETDAYPPVADRLDLDDIFTPVTEESIRVFLEE